MWDEYAQNPDKAPEWVNQYMNFIFDLEDASGKQMYLQQNISYKNIEYSNRKMYEPLEKKIRKFDTIIVIGCHICDAFFNLFFC